MKIAHIINVVEVTEANQASYLHIAQPLTIRSMVIAQRAAKGGVDVDLFAIKHRDEFVEIPEEFHWVEDISAFAWEYIPELKNHHPYKPLPRIHDIIHGLYNVSDADYFIYSNLDIGLFPHFYLAVKKWIGRGYDAFCINRRGLPKQVDNILLNEDSIELAYMLDGRLHPGIDCFVFRRDVVPSLNLGNVFVGFVPVGQVLMHQIFSHSKKNTWIKYERLTFHVGRDNPRKVGQHYDVVNHQVAKGLFPGPSWKRKVRRHWFKFWTKLLQWLLQPLFNMADKYKRYRKSPY
jgi:hypothetical protein